jgi:hypothetical protein
MAIYLGPGCLHSTYTLKGGIVPGINYTTKQCLEVIVTLIEIELLHFKTLELADIQPVLETIILCLPPDSGKRSEALLAVCKLSKTGHLKNHDLYKEMKVKAETEGGDCLHCNKRWRLHWK